MSKTKQKILDTSRQLFNELGYSNVTIRMIATELQISSGNLNYHFKKREDILEALYFEMVAVFDARVQELQEHLVSLEYMQAAIETSVVRMVAYRFFWTDLYYLLKSNSKIRVHFENVKQLRIAGYHAVFKALIKTGIMSKPSFKEEYSFLINRMLNSSNTWIYAAMVYHTGAKTTELKQNFSFELMAMLYPYLTKKGQLNFQTLFPTYFSV